MSSDAPPLPVPTVPVCHSAASSVAYYLGCYGPRKGAETPCRVTYTCYCHGESASFFFLCLSLKLHFVGDENAFNKKTRSITKWVRNIAKHVRKVKSKVRHIRSCCEADPNKYRSKVKLFQQLNFSYSETTLFQAWNAKVAFSCSLLIAVVVEAASSFIFEPLLQVDDCVP